MAGRPLRTTQGAKRGPVKPVRPLQPPQATLEGKRLRKNSDAAAIPSYFYQSLGGKGTAKHDTERPAAAIPSYLYQSLGGKDAAKHDEGLDGNRLGGRL